MKFMQTLLNVKEIQDFCFLNGKGYVCFDLGAPTVKCSQGLNWVFSIEGLYPRSARV